MKSQVHLCIYIFSDEYIYIYIRMKSLVRCKQDALSMKVSDILS